MTKRLSTVIALFMISLVSGVYSQTDDLSKAEMSAPNLTGAGPRYASETTTLFRAETTVPELSGLTIDECIMVLNLKTKYRINLELRGGDPQPQYRLDLVALREQSIERILTNLLAQTGDYLFLRTNETINLIPMGQRGSTNYVFNIVMREFDVTNQNVVGAWEPLCQRFHELGLFSPANIAFDSKPQWIADAKQEMSFQGWPSLSLNLHNASVRTVLNHITARDNDSFWIARPGVESPPKWYGVSLFRRDYGKAVLYKHDPGLHEQFDDLMRKKAQEYEEHHPSN